MSKSIGLNSGVEEPRWRVLSQPFSLCYVLGQLMHLV